MSYLPRTAVVVVHGIGEQRPLSTLRDFVGRSRNVPQEQSRKGLVVSPTDLGHVFVGPDKITNYTYARRILYDHTHLITPVEGEVGGVDKRGRFARTIHFYEYYWAYRFRDTTWRHLTGFLKRLLLVRRENLASPSALAGDGTGWAQLFRDSRGSAPPSLAC